jgi:hypothetical protein
MSLLREKKRIQSNTIKYIQMNNCVFQMYREWLCLYNSVPFIPQGYFESKVIRLLRQREMEYKEESRTLLMNSINI